MRPGEAFLYSYLWSHERDKGRESGSKIRTVCLLMQLDDRLFFFPLSHRMPTRGTDERDPVYLAIPPADCANLGLPPDGSFLILDEANVARIGEVYDLESPGPVGKLSPHLFRQAKLLLADAIRAKRLGLVPRA